MALNSNVQITFLTKEIGAQLFAFDHSEEVSTRRLASTDRKNTFDR